MFKSGTTSPLKQLMRNVCMKRILDFHLCHKSIFYQEDKLPHVKESNSLIYLFENNTHVMYKIISTNNDQLRCVVQGRFPAEFDILPHIKFDSIGIYTLGPTGKQEVTINCNDVCGKVIHVDKYLITCPSNVLREI